MDSEKSSFYSVRQAARVLGVPPEEVHKLIYEGELGAHRDRETGTCLLGVCSVHARLHRSRPEPQDSDEVDTTSVPIPASMPEEPYDEEKRGFDFDLLILLIIGTITLLAAAYTMLPVLLGEGITPPKDTAADAASTPTGGAQTEETTADTTVARQEETAPSTASSAAGWASAIGDSVMLGALDTLQQQMPNLTLIDAQGSRQPPTAIDVLRQRRAAGQPGDVVIVHVGNNGPFTSKQFDEMLRVLTGVRKVLIVNVTVPIGVPDPIAVPNNAVLADGVQRYPKNAVLVDWQAESAGHPEFFGDDGIHLTTEGAQAYAELIAARLGDDAAGGLAVPPGAKESITWGEGGTFGECVGPPSWCNLTATPQ